MSGAEQKRYEVPRTIAAWERSCGFSRKERRKLNKIAPRSPWIKDRGIRIGSPIIGLAALAAFGHAITRDDMPAAGALESSPPPATRTIAQLEDGATGCILPSAIVEQGGRTQVVKGATVYEKAGKKAMVTVRRSTSGEYQITSHEPITPHVPDYPISAVDVTFSTGSNKCTPSPN